MKKHIVMLCIFLFLVMIPFNVDAKTTKKTTTKKEETKTEVVTKEPVNIYLFRKDECPYCEAFLEWWESLPESTKVKANLVQYEVSKSKANSTLMQRVGDYFKETVNGVPYYVIGQTTFSSGFQISMGDTILAALDKEFNAEERFDVMNYIDTNIEEDPEPTKPIVATVVIIILIIAGGAGLIYIMKESDF